MYHILIADDEKDIIRLLRLYLEKDDIKVYEANDGYEALSVISTNGVDLAVIDIMMPKLNGFELIKEIRKNNNIPIMILSAKVEISDKIFGLEIGADDYITKPFDALEVAARVKANLRRYCKLGSNEKAAEQIKVRDIILDTSECVLYKNSRKIDLTSVEYKILRLFMASPGKVFTKEQIYEEGWGDAFIVDDNTIRVAISKLRDKIGEDSLKTIRGLGYRLEK
jgi:DNA-binding response OmpR family regulator